MRYLFVLLLLAGCATNMDEATRDVGYQPTEYREGYAEGCDSGYVSAGHPYYRFRKQVARFESDRLYQQGWNDGFAKCKGSYESIQRAMRR